MNEHSLRPRFDPKQDWPPIGAEVTFYGDRFTFREGDAPGWWSDDGQKYAPPFSFAGENLATLWARGAL